MTKDGQPYAAIRYKEIIKEAYLISKTIHTPYNEVLDMTPTEKGEIIKLISLEQKMTQEAIDNIKQTSNKPKTDSSSRSVNRISR